MTIKEIYDELNELSKRHIEMNKLHDDYEGEYARIKSMDESGKFSEEYISERLGKLEEKISKLIYDRTNLNNRLDELHNEIDKKLKKINNRKDDIKER